MAKLALQEIKPSKPGFANTLIVRSVSHTIVIDPSLNHEAILAALKPEDTQQKQCELWLSSLHMQGGPYINELAQILNLAVYAPYNFLPHYRQFPQTAKKLNLCGVYQPKIKADLVQRVHQVLSHEIKIYTLSSCIALHFVSLQRLWCQSIFLSQEDKKKLNNIKLEQITISN
ncbi:MAG TPA: hypothetical protein PKC21_01720 [Oligoflexia bacterium]|nr:hypothetical protein [Oligoflexia bacterium]HMR24050.1 hypothetical protein [Oligoflexia bacterium]